MTQEQINERWAEMHGKVCRYIGACERHHDRRHLAVVLAWDAYRRAPHLPMGFQHWARLGLRRMRAGRDLPGVGVSARAVEKKRSEEQGGDMNGLADTRPGPERRAQLRERCDLFWARVPSSLQHAAQLLADGSSTTDVAGALGVSQARVSQIRRQLEQLWRRL